MKTKTIEESKRIHAKLMKNKEEKVYTSFQEINTESGTLYEMRNKENHLKAFFFSLEGFLKSVFWFISKEKHHFEIFQEKH